MPFKRGNKFGAKGKPAGGRPTNEERAFLDGLREAVQRKVKNLQDKLAARYVSMAQEDQATMRHLIDKAIGNPKQEIDVQTHGDVIVHTNVDPNAGKSSNS